MLVNHTHERLAALGLAGMAKAFDDQIRQPDVTALTFEQRLGLMIDREATERENKRLAVRLKFASLRQTAIIEDVDLRTPRSIDRALSSFARVRAACAASAASMPSGCRRSITSAATSRSIRMPPNEMQGSPP